MLKKLALPLLITFILATALILPSSTTFAAADATCASDPASGPVGTTFVITCWGYTPGSHVYAYLVEPAGVATTLFDSTGALKIAADGSITYTQATKFGNAAALATGTWAFVAEELGLAKTVLHRGETTFTVTGGTEGVSGASLIADPPTVHKAAQTYNREQLPGVELTTINASEPVTLNASGFAPNEAVTFWYEPPQGGCPSQTTHYQYEVGIIFFGVFKDVQKWQQNVPIFDGLGAQLLGTLTADAGGSASGSILFYSFECEGAWRIVARGNASGRGAETYVTLIGNAVTTNAWLSADKPYVMGVFDTVQFSGYGFGPMEHISCWLTSPRGQTLGYPDRLPMTIDVTEPGVSNQYIKNKEFFADASGGVAFSLVTGSVYIAIDESFSFGGNTLTGSLTIENPIQSEGALGEWAMTCRGDTTGNTAIARFTLVGGFVDP